MKERISMNSGIYFYVNKRNNKIEYIGQSEYVDIRSKRNPLYQPKKYKIRIMYLTHKSYTYNDRRKKSKVVDADRVYLKWYESRWIRKFKPKLNKFINPIHTNFLHSIYSSWGGTPNYKYYHRKEIEFPTYDYYKALANSK